jgi:4-hydroxybenzoate polyprenyltransferase
MGRLKFLFLSTHPGPSLAVTAVTLVLAVTAELPLERVIVVTLAMLANQFSIGLSNDWLDAARDTRSSRTDKPLAAQLLSPTLVRNAAFTCVAISLGLSALLGWWVLVAQIIGIASGWVYNAWLKATPLSFLPYLVGFGILPIIVTLASPSPRLAAPWVVAVGAVLGIAAHFANAMPDIEDDRAEGIWGAPQRLGARASGIIAYLVLLVGAGLAFFGPGGTITPVQAVGLGLNIAIAAVGVWLVATRPPSRLFFQLIIIATLVNVVMIAAAGTLILA